MNIQIVTENLHSKEGTFYFELNEKSNFDRGLYNQFIYSIIDSFVSVKRKDERRKLSLEMWELFFVISKNFINHQNKFDLYQINGIEEEMISKIINDMYEIGNFISRNKEINFQDYLIG